MEIISYLIWIVVLPVVFAAIARIVLKKKWVITIIQGLILLPFIIIGMIENNPMSNIQRQVISYFGDITNDFYLKYIPFVLITAILLWIMKKQDKNEVTRSKTKGYRE